MMTLLLIEDDAGTSKLIKEMFEEYGYATACVRSANEALSWLESSSADLLVVDYNLPDMNGKAFIEALQQQKRPFPDFIVITGGEDARVAVDMMRLGARDYIIKDLHFLDMLPEVVRRVSKDLENEKKLQQAEEALRESEERYRALFENMAQGVFYQRADGALIDCNPAVLEMFGLTRDQFLGKTSIDPSWKVIHEDGSDFSGEYHPSMKALRTGKPVRNAVAGVYNPRKRDYVWLSITATPQFKPGESKPYQVFVTLHDLTERKQAGEALRESEEKFRALYDNAPLAYQSLDKNGCFIDVNPAWLSTLGYEREEVIGQYFAEFLHPNWRPHFEKNFPEFKRRGYVHNVQFKIRHKDGRYLDISFEGCIGYLPDGSFRQTYCVFQDITERKRAEQALRESEEKYRTLFEYLPIPAFTKNREGKYTSCNAEDRKYWGVNPIGHTDAELLASETATAFRQADLRVMEGGEPLSVEEHFLDTPLGARQVLSRKVPLRDASGNTVGILGAALDITERKLSEEKLKAALKEKDVLLQELYHRTRNNMQVISSMLALKSDDIEHAASLQLFKEMQHRIHSMALVHQELYQSSNLSSINLGEYINDLTDFLLRSYQVSSEISVKIQAEDVFVLIDTAIPCGLIANELISNALKHAFPDGREGVLDIELRKLDTHHIELVVADNGIGVPEGFNFSRVGTFGLRNVIALATRQLAGEIEFTGNIGLRCRMTLRDDLYKKRV